jgi:hypothetical protein
MKLFGLFISSVLSVSAIQLIDENRLWYNLEAEWIETVIKVSDAKTHEVKTILSGKYGTHSMKTAVSGYLVPLPSLKRTGSLIGNGCEDYPTFKFIQWKAKAYRKRGEQLTVSLNIKFADCLSGSFYKN